MGKIEITDWQELAHEIVSDYAGKLNIPPPRLKFVKFIKEPPNAPPGATKVPALKPEIRLNGLLFRKLFEDDPEGTELFLRCVIAHELGHVTDDLLQSNPHALSREEFEQRADQQAKEMIGLPDELELVCSKCGEAAYGWSKANVSYACPTCGDSHSLKSLFLPDFGLLRESTRSYVKKLMRKWDQKISCTW